MPTVGDALAGAQYSAPFTSAQTSVQASVLLAGGAGRLGEQMLIHLLSSPQYGGVHVLATDHMSSTEPKLRPLNASAWVQPVDDVIAIIGDHPEAALELPGKRHAVFPVLHVDDVLPLAHQAKSLGVKRFVLVTPTEVWSQPAALYAQLASEMEAQLYQIGFASLMLVRPADLRPRQRQRNIGERFWAVLTNTTAGLMTGAQHAPLSVAGTARAIACALSDDAPGLRILETAHLQHLLRN